MSASAPAAPSAQTGEWRPLWQNAAFRWPLVAAALLASTSPFWWARLSALLFDAEFALAGFFPGDAIAAVSWFLLPLVGFGCGLLASFSPCVLPLVPLRP